jgi:adenylyltransferase/sulfurtransferase
MNEITAQELKTWKETGAPFQLIDVREAYEAELSGLGGTLIPMGEIIERLNEVRTDVPVVIHCQSGNRSGAVVQALVQRYGRPNVLSLRGGIQGYLQEVGAVETGRNEH